MNAVVRLEPPITPRPDQLEALAAIIDALSDKAAANRFSQAVVDAIRAEHGPEALEPAA